ncbi:hypothetical protein D4764_10G0002310 [Takifugu flavidus]|uniref:Uncharacterized protein n=1 Tax=Takifugu flavidus TaxID=433684 RepID=A0A5C6PJU6_9TELE|nr:hypothetical protein D4764_10G0002310 [Takifugu flavidus]
MAAKALVILLVGALLASVLTAQNPLMTPGKDTSVKYKMKKLMKECQEEGEENLLHLFKCVCVGERER